MQGAESFGHAAKALRDMDRDRYLSTLVLDSAHRDPVTALYAFNAEVASIARAGVGADAGRDPAAMVGRCA